MVMFLWFFGRKTKKGSDVQVSRQDSRVARATILERRYREDVPYALPKDLEEGQRLNLQHYIFRYVLRGNYTAPLPETVSQILDVGSGTGIWGQEVAEKFPSARVFGLDLEPPQSVSLASQATHPPINYHFVQGNVLEGLPFPDQMFDYTHQRLLVGAIPLENWPGVLRELVRVTRPNGWIELFETSNEFVPSGPASAQVLTWMSNFLHSRGIDALAMNHLGEMLGQCGVRSVSYKRLAIPLGTWDRRLGVLLEKDFLALLQALKPVICKSGSIPVAQFDQYVVEATQESSTPG
jgi:ubiquinone/menaquinone biosynthesis C-methylase UbiE